jgi:AraC family transcriptional regulator
MDVPVAWGSQRAASIDVGSLRITEMRFPSALVLPAHAHDRPTLAVVVRGGFETRLGGTVEQCTRASLRLEPAGSLHSNHFAAGGAHVIVVQPDPRSALIAPVANGLEDADHRKDARADLLGHAIARELHRPDVMSQLALHALALELVVMALRASRPLLRMPRWLGRATELINDRFLDHLQVADIAAAVDVAPSELVSAFREVNGVSLGAYVRRLRLEWVASRLATTDEPIVALATESGFADQSHLTRAFRSFFGETPARYRRSIRN